MATSAATQKAIDVAVQKALAKHAEGLVAAQSKPHLIGDLRKVWRQTAEHKAHQVKLFLSSLVGLVFLQVLSDVSDGKTPFSDVHDIRSLWFYLAPFLLVAYNQYRPRLGAAEVDSAPGVTIVPSQINPDLPDVPTIDTVTTAEGDAAP